MTVSYHDDGITGPFAVWGLALYDIQTRKQWLTWRDGHNQHGDRRPVTHFSPELPRAASK